MSAEDDPTPPGDDSKDKISKDAKRKLKLLGWFFVGAVVCHYAVKVAADLHMAESVIGTFHFLELLFAFSDAFLILMHVVNATCVEAQELLKGYAEKVVIGLSLFIAGVALSPQVKAMARVLVDWLRLQVV